MTAEKRKLPFKNKEEYLDYIQELAEKEYYSSEEKEKKQEEKKKQKEREKRRQNNSRQIRKERGK